MSCHSNKCCDPCPPCETQFPETCEPLPETFEANSFVVEDSAYCKKTITGIEGQVPQIQNGFIAFVDSTSEASPNTITSRDSLGGAKFTTINSSELFVNNPSGDTRIEIGGSGDVYLDLKNPDTDDYDLRLQATAGDQRIYTSGSKLLIDASAIGLQSITNQDVGIGTDAPLHKLDVFESQAGQTAIRAYNPNTAGASSAGVIAEQGGVLSNFLARGNSELNLGTISSHPIVFKTSNADRAYITASGNVGINIASPSAQLHVQNSSAADTVRITQLGAGAALRVEDDALETTPFIVDGSGDVGIGIDVPTAKLHINNAGGGQPCLLVEDAASPDATPFVITDTGDVGIGIDAPTAKLHINNAGGGQPCLLVEDAASPDATPFAITDTGDVGIGTVTPSHKLHVVGGIRSTTDTDGIGYGTGAGGTVTQLTSRTTPVTIDQVCGRITMFSAAGSTTAATFTVNNSTVEISDCVILNQRSGTNLYDLLVTAVAAGSFNITFRTTGGTATDAPVINFAVIKAVTT
jgi:hypothetical protein